MKGYPLGWLVVLLLVFSLVGCVRFAKLHQGKGLLGLKGETTAGAVVMFNAPTLSDKQAWKDWREYWAPYDKFKAKGTHKPEVLNEEWKGFFKDVKDLWKDSKAVPGYGKP